MHERIFNMPVPSDERIIDNALFSGDIALAEALIRKAISKEYMSNPKAYHHLSLKAVALPFYEMIGKTPTLSQIETAQKVYDWTADLIHLELTSPDFLSLNSVVRDDCRGRLSEDVAFACLVRKFRLNTDSAEIFVPASQKDDQSLKTDFIAYSRTEGFSKIIHRAQVKTGSRNTTEKNVTFITMRDLDPAYSGHDAQDSLANSIVRECQGMASQQDIDKVDQANEYLESLFKGQAAA